MRTYRSVIVRPDFRLTSQNPGEGHSATEALIAPRVVSKEPPNFRHSGITRRIAQHLKLDVHPAEDLFADVQRFLWMAAQSPEPSIPAPLIDDGWHEFILFTKEYEDFCVTHCGGFMHHEPHTDAVIEPVHIDTLKPTIDLMYRVFGSKPSKNWDYIPTKELLAA